MIEEKYMYSLLVSMELLYACLGFIIWTIFQVALQHWRSRMKKEKSVEERFRERPLVLRKRREKLKSTANWPLFYYKFNVDHALPNLIWNYKVKYKFRHNLNRRKEMALTQRSYVISVNDTCMDEQIWRFVYSLFSIH